MYADSHQFVTILMCSHRDMLANPGIDKKGGGYSTCIYLGHAAERFLRFLCQERVSGAI